MLGQSSQPYRGDEANALSPVRGYVIFNAHASYQLFEQLQLFVRAQNLFNTKYSTFGVIASPSDVLADASDPRFLGPGAPFGIWTGIVVSNSVASAQRWRRSYTCRVSLQPRASAYTCTQSAQC